MASNNYFLYKQDAGTIFYDNKKLPAFYLHRRLVIQHYLVVCRQHTWTNMT